MSDKQVSLGELEENVRAASDFLLEQITAYEKAGGEPSAFRELKEGAERQHQNNILLEVTARAAIRANEEAQRKEQERAQRRAEWEKEQQRLIDAERRRKEKKQNDYLAAGRRLIEQVRAAAGGKS